MCAGRSGITTIPFAVDATLWDLAAATIKVLQLAPAEMARQKRTTGGVLSLSCLVAIRDAVTEEHRGLGLSLKGWRAFAVAGALDHELATRICTLYLERRVATMVPMPTLSQHWISSLEGPE